MSWNNVDNKHKKKYDSLFVSCGEKYERDYIIQIIMEEFSWLSRSTVEAAVDACCRLIPANRPRSRYLECLKNRLGVG